MIPVHDIYCYENDQGCLRPGEHVAISAYLKIIGKNNAKNVPRTS